MYVSGYDVAAFWDNGDGGHADHDDQMLLSTASGYRFNPMRLAIEMSRVPFYERLKIWNERFETLDEWRGGHKFPRVAADMMFQAFTTAQQRIGRDRARCEAWRMALQKSLGRPVDEAIHSVTGEPFLFADELGVVRLLGLEEEDSDLEPVLLPAAKP